jgi:mRNA-degrading endonuclease RelE of RelBE toxin-antitoxin system
MSYSLLLTPAAHKMFKKLSPTVREHLYRELQILKTNPLAGQPLTGVLRVFRSFHPPKLNNVHYRVLYEIHESQQQVMVRMLGVRENFYKRAEEMKLKPLP